MNHINTFEPVGQRERPNWVDFEARGTMFLALLKVKCASCLQAILTQFENDLTSSLERRMEASLENFFDIKVLVENICVLSGQFLFDLRLGFRMKAVRSNVTYSDLVKAILNHLEAFQPEELDFAASKFPARIQRLMISRVEKLLESPKWYSDALQGKRTLPKLRIVEF